MWPSECSENLGHDTTVVADGRQAVEAWESGDFDLILMDIQMPEMDGFEAVAAIRAREAAGGVGGPIPIIALTAHAMKGDRERCLESGFDDYLSKPIRSDELLRVLELWSDLATRPRNPKPASSIALAGDRIDLESALANLGGDAELLREILALFLDECPRLISQIEDAIDRSDSQSLKRLAHSLRGVASHFSLKMLVEATAELEAGATLGDLGASP